MTRTLTFAALIAAGALLFTASARADDPGDTSGPAAGTPVMPSTSVQKDNTHIPDVTPSDLSGPSGTSAGAPGIEGKRGTQAGKAWAPPAEIQKKNTM
jgi:hypothetical protein